MKGVLDNDSSTIITSSYKLSSTESVSSTTDDTK